LYAIAERFRFYPASELSSERVRGIYINPLLGIGNNILYRGVCKKCLANRGGGLVSSYNFLQTYTGLYKHPQGYTPPEGGDK